MEVVTAFLEDTDNREGQGELKNLLTRFHKSIALPDEPRESTTLVQHHIPLQPGPARV